MEPSTLDFGEGPAAVLLHGQPGNGGDWLPVAERLRERMRVLAPDRPGYGASGRGPAGIRANAAALIDLLDRLEIESAVVVGHSLGTGVALAAAIDHPRRVRALVLAAPVAPSIPPATLDRLLARRYPGAPAARLGFGIVGLGLTLPPLRRLAHAAVPSLSTDQIAITAAEWRAGAVWRSFHAEQRSLVAELPSLTPALASVAQRVTILYGTRDRITPPAHARRLARDLPQARLVPADGAGHMLPQQRPELIAEAIEGAAS